MGYDVEFTVFGPYEGEGHADIYIIFNGWNHFTATGTAFALHVHTHTAIIEMRLACMLDF